ncbi:MAG: hypothetical protein K2X66_00300 [Cyanobacteria bacterium]|nr:hypothetical protein [Cyanobacteriota bacterium]
MQTTGLRFPAPQFGSIAPKGGFKGPDVMSMRSLETKNAQDLISTLQSTAALLSKTDLNKGVFNLGTAAKPYTVSTSTDGNFTAKSQDGKITIQLFHDSRSMGMRTLIYQNTEKPNTSGYTRDARVMTQAEELGQHFRTLLSGNGGGLDI